MGVLVNTRYNHFPLNLGGDFAPLYHYFFFFVAFFAAFFFAAMLKFPPV